MKRQFLLTRMLLLFALIVGSSNAWATDPDLTLDFTSAWTEGEKDGDESVFTKTVSSTTYTIKGQGGANFKFNSGYFIFGKTNAYIKLPIVDFDVEKIEVVGRSGASGSVVHNIFVGTTAVSTAKTGLDDVTNSFTIASGYETAGTQYILKVTSNHNAQITYVKYYRKSGGDPSAVKTPTFDPVGGTYTSAQSVEISCGTAGATIHYTTNGVDPTESDATYSSAVSITTSGTVLKAMAFKDGMTASSVASATYTIKPNKPTVSAAGATVTISGDEGLTFYYTTDNSAPDNNSTEYTGPFNLLTDCTIKAKAYDAYGNASDASTAFKFKYMPLAPKNIGSGYYEKVTDVSSLENGDAILIVNETAGKALGPQSGNNCPQKDVTISAGVISNKGDAQKVILVKKSEAINEVATDVFYFYTGSAYLYAASSSSNHLKTEATPDDNNNSRATITISSGDATILFTGSNSRKWLKYNSSSSLFSCYKTDDTDQNIVQIYKEVAHNESVTVGAKGYATYCNSTYALDFTDKSIKAYTISSTNGSSLTLTQKNKVAKNEPVLLYSETNNDSQSIPVIAEATATEGNKLVAGTGAAVTWVENGNQYYILYTGGAKPGFYRANNSTVAVGKAYLDLTGLPATAREFFTFFDDETTGINAVDVENANAEVKNNVYYNLNGQRVANPSKGLYIVNGKKVIMK